jgi:hypothetical protein
MEIICLPAICRSRIVLHSLMILSVAEIRTVQAEGSREDRLSTSVKDGYPDSRQSVSIPKMVAVIKSSCIPKAVISSVRARDGSEPYAVQGIRGVKVKHPFHLSIRPGRLVGTLSEGIDVPWHQAYQSTFGLQILKTAGGKISSVHVCRAQDPLLEDLSQSRNLACSQASLACRGLLQTAAG